MTRPSASVRDCVITDVDFSFSARETLHGTPDYGFSVAVFQREIVLLQPNASDWLCRASCSNGFAASLAAKPLRTNVAARHCGLRVAWSSGTRR